MKILFTGASSFTGYWFATTLADAGHNVRAVLTQDSVDAYVEGLRRQRVLRVASKCDTTFACRFGDERFLSLLRQEKYDLLCHHAANATNYKSLTFDVCSAVASNTHHVLEVVQTLAEHGGAAMVLTGSIFEGGEGAGSEGLPHFSPYGLSKALTSETFQYYCQTIGLTCGKFVISNPFGPYEEPRFTAYLVRCWQAGETAMVQTPTYVRDNIHVSLLASHYRAFAERLQRKAGFVKTNPSGYVETQGAFAHRFAGEMSKRWRMECPVQCANQTEFNEPHIRLNTEPVQGAELGWNEVTAWDELAAYYAASTRIRA